jgi:hypothetical protein
MMNVCEIEEVTDVKYGITQSIETYSIDPSCTNKTDQIEKYHF